MALFNFTPASIIADVIYGVNLLTGSINADVVGIYDADSNEQLFQAARPMGCAVNETSKVMEHPVETGAVISDHHVVNPVTISLDLVVQSLSYKTTYQQIKNAFVTAKLLSVQTKTGVYRNMIIANMPHEENPDMFDAVPIALQLKEILFVMPSSVAAPNAPTDYSPIDPENTNTINRGLQISQVIAISATVSAYVNKIIAWGK